MSAAWWRRPWTLLAHGRVQTLSIATVSHGVVAVAAFLQMVLLARILSVAAFGELATILALAMVMEAAVNARGSETALAAFAELPDRDAEARIALTGRLLRIDLAWSLAAYAVLGLAVVVADAVRGTDSRWLLMLMLGGVLAFPWGTTKAYLTVFLGPRVFAPIEISYAATILVVGVGLTLALGGFGFVVGMVLGSVVRSVLGLHQAGLPRKVLLERAGSAAGAPGQRLWWYGVTGTARSALLNLAGQMDVLLLAAVASPAAVGLYRAAKTISGLTQRATQPIWFVLKRPIIAATRADGAAYSRRMIGLAALGFAAIGVIVIPAVLYFASDIAAVMFGARYRGSAEALVWLIPAAWIYYGMTGWSNLFGSVAGERMTVIGLYVGQIALFALAALIAGRTMGALAFALALSQVFVAAGFWWLLLSRSTNGKQPAPGAPGTGSSACD